jgi:anti-sigma factor RsiW
MLSAIIEFFRVSNASCREQSLRISKDVDGQLNRPTRLAVRTHLVTCSPCRHFAQYLRFFRRAAAVADRQNADQALTPLRMPDEVRERLRRTIGS